MCEIPIRVFEKSVLRRAYDRDKENNILYVNNKIFDTKRFIQRILGIWAPTVFVNRRMFRNAIADVITP